MSKVIDTSSSSSSRVRRLEIESRSASRLYEMISESISSLTHLTSQTNEYLELLVGGYILSYSLQSPTTNAKRPFAVLSEGPPGTFKSALPVILARVLDIPSASFTASREASLLELFIRERVQSARDDKGGYQIVKVIEDGYFSSVTREANAKRLTPIVVLDEIDKVPPQDLLNLYQALPFGFVRDVQGGIHPLNGLFVGTKNAREYDPTSRDLPEALADRFMASVKMGFYSPKDLERIIEIGVSASAQPRDINRVSIPSTAVDEVRRILLKDILPNQWIRRCFAGTLAVLQGTYDDSRAQEIAKLVRRRPGTRGAMDAFYVLAALVAVKGYLDEDLVFRAIKHALYHRFDAVPGEDKINIIDDAADCACRERQGAPAMQQQQSFFR